MNASASFSFLLKRNRLDWGLSQVELAQASGVSLPTIQNIESGKANPSLSTLGALLGALELEIAFYPKSADWDLLAECGAPLASSKMSAPSHKRSGNRITGEILVRTLTVTCRELSENPKLPDRDRKSEAVQALVFAVRSHFPTFFKKRCSSKWIQSYLPEKPSGRLIKLKRVAAAKLAEYL